MTTSFRIFTLDEALDEIREAWKASKKSQRQWAFKLGIQPANLSRILGKKGGELPNATLLSIVNLVSVKLTVLSMIPREGRKPLSAFCYIRTEHYRQITQQLEVAKAVQIERRIRPPRKKKAKEVASGL